MRGGGGERVARTRVTQPTVNYEQAPPRSAPRYGTWGTSRTRTPAERTSWLPSSGARLGPPRQAVAWELGSTSRAPANGNCLLQGRVSSCGTLVPSMVSRASIRTAMGPIRAQPDCQSLAVVISCAHDSHLWLHRVQAPVVCPARAWAGRPRISHPPLGKGRKADTAPPRSLAHCACSPRPFPSPSIKCRCWGASNTWSGERLHAGLISTFFFVAPEPHQ
jgi:hypothetical protein